MAHARRKLATFGFLWLHVPRNHAPFTQTGHAQKSPPQMAHRRDRRGAVFSLRNRKSDRKCSNKTMWSPPNPLSCAMFSHPDGVISCHANFLCEDKTLLGGALIFQISKPASNIWIHLLFSFRIIIFPHLQRGLEREELASTAGIRCPRSGKYHPLYPSPQSNSVRFQGMLVS